MPQERLNPGAPAFCFSHQKWAASWIITADDFFHLPPAATFLFVRQKERWKRKNARGTFRKVPLDPSSRPRGEPRGGFPHWILLPGDGNHEAPGKAQTLTGRGGAAERPQAVAVLTKTAEAQPVRCATTGPSLGSSRGLRGFYEGREQLRVNTPAFERLALYVATFVSVRTRPPSPREVDSPLCGKDGGSATISSSYVRSAMRGTPSGAPRQLPQRGSLKGGFAPSRRAVCLSLGEGGRRRVL